MKRPSAPAPVSKPSASTAKKSAPRAVPGAVKPDPSAVKSKASALASQLAEQRRRSAWLSGFRFSVFSLIMAGVLTVGILSLIPRVQELVTQRQQIAALSADIASAQASITAKETERTQWNDPTFIETQAREKLFFVQPGDVSYLVINDLTPAQLTLATARQATTTVQHTESHWLGNLLSSVWGAGAAPVSAQSGSTPTGASK